MSDISVLSQRPTDDATIYSLTQRAFASMSYSDGTEPEIVDMLRSDGDLLLSLIALRGDVVVGHVAFSPVSIEGQIGNWVALGPVSVEPALQKQGIGNTLIQAGLDRLQLQVVTGCVLVGSPDYYQRFGFISDGQLSYGETDRAFVQYLAFEDSHPVGEIQFATAFSLES